MCSAVKGCAPVDPLLDPLLDAPLELPLEPLLLLEWPLELPPEPLLLLDAVPLLLPPPSGDELSGDCPLEEEHAASDAHAVTRTASTRAKPTIRNPPIAAPPGEDMTKRKGRAILEMRL